MHVMEIALCGTFVIIFVSSGLLSAVVSGREIIVVNFEMLHYHPQLKKCAATSQNKPEYVGCRVSVQTGQCEGLDYNWGLHPTMEKGYAYAKKLHVQQTFQPPIRLVKYDDSPTDIRVVPVVLNTGAQIDISISVMALDELSSTDELFILRFYHSEVTLDKDMFQIR
ncbi:uncharacterized protein LOC123551832 [Mercenaria mercenaria]|uniref:uncharacterized protein LOC123551832 n=1 Tax=Mercenaria mercenaria TaxID=6596 RepID=UPI00234F98D3|nr:uncharacterized protein LOC123551832 [Mercenaria mercenaria]XP_053397364.1 uncharacterized protein LOC123551832 [Mercenaria mercenaria]